MTVRKEEIDSLRGESRIAATSASVIGVLTNSSQSGPRGTGPGSRAGPSASGRRLRPPDLRTAWVDGRWAYVLREMGFGRSLSERTRMPKWLTVTDFGGIYRRPHVPSKIRWPQVLFQKQVIAKSLFLDLLTREAGKASHMTVNLSKEPLFEGQTGLTPKIRDGQFYSERQCNENSQSQSQSAVSC